nr:hypothetical protein [Tanacetum cinerariifolium]
MELVGDESEIVPLYYHMFDNFQIPFEREEFCVVTGLKFRVEYWADYDDEDEPIHFRRRAFPRVAAWSSNMNFYRHMLFDFLHGRVPAKRLIPDEIEAGSGWWVSSRAYFDGRASEAE